MEKKQNYTELKKEYSKSVPPASFAKKYINSTKTLIYWMLILLAPYTVFIFRDELLLSFEIFVYTVSFVAFVFIILDGIGKWKKIKNEVYALATKKGNVTDTSWHWVDIYNTYLRRDNFLSILKSLELDYIIWLREQIRKEINEKEENSIVKALVKHPVLRLLITFVTNTVLSLAKNGQLIDGNLKLFLMAILTIIFAISLFQFFDSFILNQTIPNLKELDKDLLDLQHEIMVSDKSDPPTISDKRKDLELPIS